MSTANVPNRRRRQVAFGALTVLLHVLVFDWFGGQLGQPSRRHATPEPVSAQLVPDDTPAPVPEPVAPPQPQPEPPPPVPDVKPEPVPPPPPPVALAEAAPAPAAVDAPADGALAGAGAAGAAPAAGQGDAAAAPAGVQSAPDAPPAPAAEPAQRRYRVDIPPPADITLDVARTDADGTKWKGDALLAWTTGPAGYKVRVEAGIRIVFAHVNLLALTSEGKLGDEGFMPDLMTEKRRGRALTATHFGRDLGLMTFSATVARYGIAAYAQDKASMPLQLSAIARGDPKQLTGKLEFQVGEDRSAAIYTFEVAGQEDIDTGLGRLATWHLVRPPKPGSYHSRLDIWLAPDHGWYPVQIRNVEANGAVTTQTASKIVIKNTGS